MKIVTQPFRVEPPFAGNDKYLPHAIEACREIASVLQNEVTQLFFRRLFRVGSYSRL